MSTVRSKNWCAYCGQNLYGPVIGEPQEGVCVACMKKYTKACPECTGPGKYKYQKHKGPGPQYDEKNKVLTDRKCGRCGDVHPDEVRQLKCAVCKNERMVAEYPKKVTA